MTHLLLTVGKPKAGYIVDGLADYLKRLKHFGGCGHEFVRPERAGNNANAAQLKQAEGKRLLARLKPNDRVWALDPGGKAWSSRQWARGLDKARLMGSPRLVLIIGGAEGLAPEVLERADATVSFGPPTLAHEIAALVSLEQLYRAHTILAGMPYHRA